MKLEDRGIKPNVKKTIKEIAFEDPEVGRHVQQAYRIALDAVDKRIKNCDEAHDVEYMDDKERANYYERVRQQNKKSDLQLALESIMAKNKRGEMNQMERDIFQEEFLASKYQDSLASELKDKLKRLEDEIARLKADKYPERDPNLWFDYNRRQEIFAKRDEILSQYEEHKRQVEIIEKRIERKLEEHDLDRMTSCSE